MANKILSYLKLAWLCFNLGFRIFVFGLSYLLLKFNQKKAVSICLASLILLTASTNVYVFNKKNTAVVELNQVQAINYPQEILDARKVILDENHIQESIEYYRKIEQMNVKSLEIFLNLNQLNQALGNDELAQKYLDQAKEILPSIDYLKKLEN